MRGDVLNSLGRHDEGKRSYETAIRLDPTDARIRANSAIPRGVAELSNIESNQ